MYTLPLYALAFYHSFDKLRCAYRQGHLQIPITDGSDNQTSYPKGSPEYIEKINQLQQSKLHIYLQDVLDKAGIRKDLVIEPKKNPHFCGAVGSNYFTKGDARIYVQPGFYETDINAFGFTAKHEISHIKNNDTCLTPLVGAICQVAFIVFSVYLNIPIIPIILMSPFIGYFTERKFDCYKEGKADDFAINTSTSDELKGGLRLMKSFQILNLMNKFFAKKSKIDIERTFRNFQFTDKGENRFNFSHPSLASRIQKIENALNEREVPFLKWNVQDIEWDFDSIESWSFTLTDNETIDEEIEKVTEIVDLCLGI